MSGRGVHVRRLTLRVRGDAAGAYRSFAARLGAAVAEGARALGPREKVALRLRVRPGESVGELGQRIARALSEGGG